MKPSRPDNILLEITVAITLFSLIIFGSLATVIQIQIDHEMLAAESIAQLGNPNQ
jgi:hypothetical protein